MTKSDKNDYSRMALLTIEIRFWRKLAIGIFRTNKRQYFSILYKLYSRIS